MAAPVPVNRMVAAVSWSWLAEPLRSRVTSRLPRLAASVGFRCAAHEYRMVAGGHAHALLYNKLMPWDHLAGCLIAEEAGAYVRRFDGSRYQPQHLDGGLLIASDEASWHLLREKVFTI